MKILFSPIGGTDPIKYDRDGSMLHICRFYKPDIVYLYLSKEMLERHNTDNRYVGCLEKLGELLNHSFKVFIIEKPELDNAQEYNYFYDDFRNILNDIEKENGVNNEILLNIASGTPAMKSALLVLSIYSEGRYNPIQVMTPEAKSNERYENRDNYDYELFWECNEDNNADAICRCEEAKIPNLIGIMKNNIIINHIEAYDYNAALSVANSNQSCLSDDAYNLIKLASYRMELNKSEIAKIDYKDKDNLFPIKSGDNYKIFEFVLSLKIKVMKQEYADFARGITPAIVNILRMIFENKSGLRIDDLVSVDKKGERWSKDKLSKTLFDNQSLLDILNEGYKESPKGFTGGELSYHHVATLIQIMYINDSDLHNLITEIKDVVKKVRNFAAHEIVSVSDDWINKQVGKNAKQILDLIIRLIDYTGINVKREYWNSYYEMNERIIGLLR